MPTVKALEGLLGNHPNIGDCQGERAGAAYADFDLFCDQVEVLLGESGPTLMDADEDRDGYSADSAFEAWQARITPADYVAGVRA